MHVQATLSSAKVHIILLITGGFGDFVILRGFRQCWRRCSISSQGRLVDISRPAGGPFVCHIITQAGATTASFISRLNVAARLVSLVLTEKCPLRVAPQWSLEMGHSGKDRS